ncbi:MAG TPA: hypothetical protein VFE34_05395 [Dongiaceae bacterium]|nr:hypothetical protein [Dongiaceae bacterium]
MELWIVDASTSFARVGDCLRIGSLLASHRRTIALIALIAVGSLFTLPFLFALLGVPIVLGFISAWIQHMTEGDQA